MNIKQALHGYRDGHTLLAASVELSSEVRRLMLPLSDMSGSAMIKGFESYITGYPVREMNAYALAKTWSAPEMKRPGCVWTHTLFIDFNDLLEIREVSALSNLLQRPTSPDSDYADYRYDLQTYFVEGQVDLTDHGEAQKSSVKKLIESLYENGERPVLFKKSHSHILEADILRIWLEQWPRLKRSFTFCTGAILPRTFLGKPMELQVVPLGTDSNKLSGQNFQVVDDTTPLERPFSLWIDLVFDDIYTPSSRLRNFLNYFGSDLQMTRALFRPLVQAFIFFINNRPIINDSLKFLSSEFPSADNAGLLKSAVLLDQANPFKSFLPSYNEASLIASLSVTEYYESFDFKKINYLQRFLGYFENINQDNIRLLKQIIDIGPNPNGEEAITKLANSVTDNHFPESFWKEKQLSTIFISLSPGLTYNRKFWKINEKNQLEIINLLQKKKVTERVDWSRIIQLLVEVNSSIDPAVFDNYINQPESIILDHVDNIGEVTIGRNWLNYLSNRPKSILSWLNNKKSPKVGTIDLVVDILDPNSEIVILNGINPWLDFLSTYEKPHLVEVPITIHSFCLALAFNLKDLESQEIFSLSFEIVYYALAAEQLPYNSWRNLEKHTIPLSFWKDWDKCKKIVIALVDHFIENKWSIRPIEQNIQSDEIRERLNRYYKKRR